MYSRIIGYINLTTWIPGDIIPEIHNTQESYDTIKTFLPIDFFDCVKVPIH